MTQLGHSRQARFSILSKVVDPGGSCLEASLNLFIPYISVLSFLLDKINRLRLPIMKVFFALSLVPLFAAATPMMIDTIHNEAAPILSSIQSETIPDSYIVVFKKHVSPASASVHHEWVQDQHIQIESAKAKRDLGKRSQFPLMSFSGRKHTYDIAGSLLGYSGHFDEEVIERVRRHPDVSISSLLYRRTAHDRADTCFLATGRFR